VAETINNIPFHERLTCSVGEAAKATSLSKSKIYELLAEGRLQSVHVDKRNLIRVPSLLQLIGTDHTATATATVQRGDGR
jgi:excisionase family DNA binding protein